MTPCFVELVPWTKLGRNLFKISLVNSLKCTEEKREQSGLLKGSSVCWPGDNPIIQTSQGKEQSGREGVSTEAGQMVLGI